MSDGLPTATALDVSAVAALIGHAAIHDLTVAFVAGAVKRFRMDAMRSHGNGGLVFERGTNVMTCGPDDKVGCGP